RTYPSLEEARADGALLVGGVSTTTATLANTFGPAPYQKAVVFSATIPENAGDIVRLFGQVTTEDTTAVEMQGQAIWNASTQLSPWSTSDQSQPMPTLPLWTDAIDRADAGNVASYLVTVHGVASTGGAIDPGLGYLQAIRFAPASVPGGSA